jgi:hypothetical protein
MGRLGLTMMTMTAMRLRRRMMMMMMMMMMMRMMMMMMMMMRRRMMMMMMMVLLLLLMMMMMMSMTPHQALAAMLERRWTRTRAAGQRISSPWRLVL